MKKNLYRLSLQKLKNSSLSVGFYLLSKTDYETIKVIKKFKKKVIFQSNKGYGDALITGLKKN